MNTPCIFEQQQQQPFPAFSQAAFPCGEAPCLSFAPQQRRQQPAFKSYSNQQRFNPYFDKQAKNDAKSINYTLVEKESSYVLTLQKRLARDALVDAVYNSISLSTPKYRMVQDFFGNSFYVKEDGPQQPTEEEIAVIGRKLARKEFQDYEIELNHLGNELKINSDKDKISKVFAFSETTIDDFDILKCGIDDTDEQYVVLKLKLTKTPMKNQSGDLANLIQWAEGSKSTDAQLQQQEQQIRLEKQRHEQEQKKIRKEQDRVRKAKLEQEKAKRLEQIRLRKIEEEKAKRLEQAKKEEEENRVREQAEQLEREKADSLRREQQLQEWRALELQMRQEQEAAEKERKLNEKKASSSATSYSNNTPIKININFNEKPHDDASASKVQRKSTSTGPILENVEDAEEDRYRSQLDRTPNGTSIIEDI